MGVDSKVHEQSVNFGICLLVEEGSGEELNLVKHLIICRERCKVSKTNKTRCHRISKRSQAICWGGVGRGSRKGGKVGESLNVDVSYLGAVSSKENKFARVRKRRPHQRAMLTTILHHHHHHRTTKALFDARTNTYFPKERERHLRE